MIYAPIILFVYNRPEHTKKTVEALKKNIGAENSILYIFSDGPKEKSKETVEEVRKYIKTIQGFREVNIVLREKNMGLAESVIAGVTEVVGKHGRVIVLEDDLVTTPFLLTYMNEALEKYEDEKKVFSITGYSDFPKGNRKLAETYFVETAHSWTWATWKDRWVYFDPLATGWEELKTNYQLRKKFDYYGTYKKSQMLFQQMEEHSIDSWLIRWCYTIFKQKGLTLYPNKSLCENIGRDGTGVHCKPNNERIQYELQEAKIQFFPQEICELEETRKQFIAMGRRVKIDHYRERCKYYLLHPFRVTQKLRSMTKSHRM